MRMLGFVECAGINDSSHVPAGHTFKGHSTSNDPFLERPNSRTGSLPCFRQLLRHFGSGKED